MVTSLLIRHKVTDYPAWKARFEDQDATRGAHGCQGGRLFRNDADPNELLILLEWDNLERAYLFAQSDELREDLKRAEVADDPDLWFLGAPNQAPG
jgi:heme-degrading monooxygenase HmoA